jgi:hypothetical protein
VNGGYNQRLNAGQPQRYFGRDTSRIIVVALVFAFLPHRVIAQTPIPEVAQMVRNYCADNEGSIIRELIDLLSIPNLATCGDEPVAGEKGHQLQSPTEGESMTNLKGLASIVSELRVERTNLVNQLKHVDAALAVLGKLDGGRSYTEPRRTLSASARKKISLAQKARWKGSRKGRLPAAGEKTMGSAPAKRTMSAAARRKIAAAQRVRWAKLKAGKKTA